MEDLDAKVAEALAAETQARDLAFLADIPVPLCGTPVFTLDLRNLVLLTHAGNPFIVGGAADIEDVRMILWLQSPLYRTVDPEPRAGWSALFPRRARKNPRQAFLDSLPAVPEAAAVAEMRAWIEDTFYDAPPGKSRPAGTEGAILEEPIASFVASWVDLLGSEYGWLDDVVVGTAQRRGIALRRLFQYYRCCLRRRDPQHPFSSAAVVKLHAELLREPDEAGEPASGQG